MKFLFLCAFALLSSISFAGDQYHGTAKYIESNKHDSYCVIDEASLVHCWGAELQDPPADLGEVKELSVNGPYACAVRTDDKPVCWGPSNDYGGGVYIPLQAKVVRSISPSEYGGCAITLSGKALCWRRTNWNWDHPSGPPQYSTELVPLPTEFDGMTKIYGDWGGACLTDEVKIGKCWQHDNLHIPLPNLKGAVLKLSFDDSSTACYLTLDNKLDCGGLGYDPMWPPKGDPVPANLGRVRDVSLSRGRACAIRDDGLIVCWSLWDEVVPPPATIRAVKVATGMSGGCAILETSKEVVCWDGN